jgi:hypothetical protein
MQSFHCRFMDDTSHAVFLERVDAENLEAAKHAAFKILCAAPAQLLSRVRGLEIWQGNHRLYPTSDLLAS